MKRRVFLAGLVGGVIAAPVVVANAEEEFTSERVEPLASPPVLRHRPNSIVPGHVTYVDMRYEYLRVKPWRTLH